MKSRIINILIGMGIMGIFTGCGQVVKTAMADENGYLKYCGSQKVFEDVGRTDKRIEVYEDTQHNKVIYVSMYQSYSMDIDVTDNNFNNEISDNK